jgi:hypothetical protein
MQDIFVERDQALAETNKPLCRADEISSYIWAKPTSTTVASPPHRLRRRLRDQDASAAGWAARYCSTASVMLVTGLSGQQGVPSATAQSTGTDGSVRADGRGRDCP